MFLIHIEMLRHIKLNPNRAAKDIIAEFKNEEVLHNLLDRGYVTSRDEAPWPDFGMITTDAGEAVLGQHEYQEQRQEAEKRESKTTITPYSKSNNATTGALLSPLQSLALS